VRIRCVGLHCSVRVREKERKEANSWFSKRVSKRGPKSLELRVPALQDLVGSAFSGFARYRNETNCCSFRVVACFSRFDTCWVRVGKDCDHPPSWQIGASVTTLQVEAVMKSLDVDNDGRVTFAEFSNALELIEYVPHPLHLTCLTTRFTHHNHTFHASPTTPYLPHPLLPASPTTPYPYTCLPLLTLAAVPPPTHCTVERSHSAWRELLRISERAHPGLDLKCLATPGCLLFLALRLSTVFAS